MKIEQLCKDSDLALALLPEAAEKIKYHCVLCGKRRSAIVLSNYSLYELYLATVNCITLDKTAFLTGLYGCSASCLNKYIHKNKAKVLMRVLDYQEMRERFNNGMYAK
jgi:hypothetical protein